MFNYSIIIVSVFIGILLVWQQIFCFVFLGMVFLASIILAISGTVTAHIMLSTKHSAKNFTFFSSFSNFHQCLIEKYNAHIQKPVKRLPVVFGKSVDIILQDLLDLIIRDLITPWLEDLALCHQELRYSIKKEIWYALGKLNKRLGNVNKTKLIAMDMVSKVTYHFEKIRLAQSKTGSDDTPGKFYLSHHLLNSEKELNYLRKISELILVTLFSKSLISHPCNKSLLIEVLTCKVLFPGIELLTDPDYINQKILECIEYIVQTSKNHKYSSAQAKSFEEFLQLIIHSEDINYLKHVRYNIMTEIMQATTIQNLKKEKNIDFEKEEFMVEKLKNYLRQLKFAKLKCENRLRDLGCPGFPIEFTDCDSLGTEKKILPFEKILENPYGRKLLYKFLENSGQETLLTFWASVEELRSTDKKNWHHLGAEIYYTFIHSEAIPLEVEKSVRRRIESFLLGNSGPDVFYEVQANVIGLLKEKVYTNFCLTELYDQFLLKMGSYYQDSKNVNEILVKNEKEETSAKKDDYANKKLNQLEERLYNKSQALQALRLSLKPESKVLSGLEKEVEDLEGEKRQLEAHLIRTEVWEEHLGKWRAVVQSAELSDDKESPQFVLVVHIVENDLDIHAVSKGWVVLRKLSEFNELHRQLSQVWSGIKQLELPFQSSKFFFGKQAEKSSLEKAKAQIQKYLEFVLQDERLNTSEYLYTFLCPSSENLKISNPSGVSPKKNKFSFSTFFKSSSNPGNEEISRESDEEDYSLFDENEFKLVKEEGTDAIAEPLYALIGEIFDLRGVFRWLRKTLISFVQVTYGRTISRQIRETVMWLISDQMLHFYIRILIHSCWQNGVFVRKQQNRTEEEKKKTRIIAKEQFINNTPEVLNNLVGQQNARRGAIKIFEALQDLRLNKQLFYDLLEVLIYELFPEIKKKKLEKRQI